MKSILGLALIVTTVVVVAQSTVTNLSPAEKAVAEAKRSTATRPEAFAGYNQLAAALVQRGQETADPNYLAQAKEAVKKSLALAPDNLDTKKIEISILLADHEYPAALEAATVLNKKVPDDVTVYGLLTDADIALGKYDDAEKAAQWMLNLRPGNVPALTRAASLRELFGDAEGSAELLDMVLDSTSPANSADRAWVLTQLGHLRLGLGDTAGAEQFFQQALKAYPDYDDALEYLATVRSVQQRYDEAASLLRRSYAVAPRTERLYLLGDALAMGKHNDEAVKAFAEFEAAANAKVQRRINSNIELSLYYADRAQRPSKAIEVASQEYSWRRDVYTLDAYAWALHVNGKDAEARKQEETALAVGVKDAQIFYHAGEISLILGDRTAAERYLKQSGELNTEYSERARLALASISQTAAR
jgi:tetratricopeptide (TPR) repeat protein